MSAEHTPGPWMSEYCGKDTIKVFKISDKRRITTIKVKTPTMDEANAHLIAAAPALLEAARNFREWWANHFEDYDEVSNGELLCLDNDFEAAIAQAEKE